MHDDIVVTERRTYPLNQTAFQKLSSSSAVYKLICDGIISLVRSKKTPYGIRAFNSVGQVLLEDGTRLVVAEKVASSLKSLLQWQLPKDIRELQISSPVGVGSPILMAFAERFLYYTGEYLKPGRLKEYQYRTECSSFPHGKILVRETMRLYSRGQRGVLGFQQAHLTANLLPNRLITLGLHAVEAYAASNPKATQVRDASRNFAPLFEDVDWYHLMQSSRAIKAEAFQNAFSDERVTGNLSTALAFARALIMHFGSWPETSEATIPSSYFINLETLFEDAVRQIIKEALEPKLQVLKGDKWNRPLFSLKPDVYIADPDIVIGAAPYPNIVADCKYKDIEHQSGRAIPHNDDVYQLHTHCAAFEGRKGILIYPGEIFSLNRLGHTPDGTEIYYAVINIADMKNELLKMLKQLGLD